MKKNKHIIFLIAGLIFSCRQHDKSSGNSTTTITQEENQFKTNCGCETDSLKTENTTNCDTTFLRNESKLYYQFNCDSIWLTLENLKGLKRIIYVEKDNFDEFYGIQWRIGYKFIKEYNKYLLFRSGCPANGPCNFVLIDKTTGELNRVLGELIYDHENNVFYDFLLYFSTTDDSIIVDFIDLNKQMKITIDKSHFTTVTPEYNFEKISFSKGIITLTYFYGDNNNPKLKTISVDTKKYSHQYVIGSSGTVGID
ncbi:hypothetical protein [Lacihabitans soyangensis]|uniref:Lipoprotein n=1 Tax=Lacihabitans soyangensis TaxID=869394 RepID=A0AAE3KSP6_9BACT|nr:hypothetical protein [Lacihabitans soyangensis]MCP9762819.1 hypothetical protein [Lacihabitans soyangensis]